MVSTSETRCWMHRQVLRSRVLDGRMYMEGQQPTFDWDGEPMYGK